MDVSNEGRQGSEEEMCEFRIEYDETVAAFPWVAAASLATWHESLDLLPNILPSAARREPDVCAAAGCSYPSLMDAGML